VTRVDADVQRLMVADFDGDGRGDVLTVGTSELAVRTFDTGAFVDISRIGAPDQRPAVGDLSGDGRADLALTVGAGIGVLLGQENRSLAPVVYTATRGSSTVEMRFALLNTDATSYGDEAVTVTSGAIIKELVPIVGVMDVSFELRWPIVDANLDEATSCDGVRGRLYPRPQSGQAYGVAVFRPCGAACAAEVRSRPTRRSSRTAQIIDEPGRPPTSPGSGAMTAIISR
jgi:hypothetical protein